MSNLCCHFALTKPVSADGRWNRTGVQPFCLSVSWFYKKLLWPLLYAVPETQMQHRLNGFLHMAHSPVLQSSFWTSILDPRQGRVTMKQNHVPNDFSPQIQPSWILGRIATRLNLAVMSCVHSCGGRVLPFPLSHLTTIAAAREKKALVFAGASKLSKTDSTHVESFMLCQLWKGRIGPILQAVRGMQRVFASNSHKQSVQRLLHNKSVQLRGTEPKSTCWCNILWIPIETTGSIGINPGSILARFFFSFFDLFSPPKLSLPGWNAPVIR